MTKADPHPVLARRSFLARLGTGLVTCGAALGADVASAQAQTPAARVAFTPATHAQDDWFDAVGSAKHRLYMDTTTVDGVAHAIFWSNNFLNASRNGYALTDADSALVIGVRHESTPFAFTDAMWAKYGRALAGHAAGFTDPTTKGVPSVNLLQSVENRAMANRGITFDSVAKRGVRLAVCSLATRAIATEAARGAANATPRTETVDEIVKDLTSNLVTNAHMVPAGIVALSRAQERGFTFNYIA